MIKRLKMKTALAAITVIAVVLCFSMAADARKITSFSADMVHLNKNGAVSDTQKMYVTPTHVRMENAPGGDGAGMIMIYNVKNNIMWMINTKEKKYFEQKVDPDQIMKGLQASVKPESEKVLGTEKVNGYTCTKKRVETTVTFMGINRKVTQTIWTSDKFDYPLRTKSDSGDMTEVRNIKPGSQPPSLFTLPAGYTKTDPFSAGAGGSSDDETGDSDSLKDISEAVKDKIKNFKLPFGKD